MFDALKMIPEEWRRDYETLRYLREVDDPVLEQRLHNLTSNLWVTDTAGNVVPREPNSRRALMRLISHVMLGANCAIAATYL